MSGFAVTLLAHDVDPEEALRALRKVAPRAEIERGESGFWRATITEARGLLRRAFVLKVTHDPGFMAGRWPTQEAGIRGTFERAGLEEDRWEAIASLLGQVGFALGCVMDPEPEGNGDGRWDLVQELAGELDACLLGSSGLFDSGGQLLAGFDGEVDEDAVFPDWIFPEDEDPVPPTAERVARRALVLAAVAGRGLVEMQSREDPEVREAAPRIANWLASLGVLDECEPEELELLRTPAGELTEQTLIDSVWRMESLAVLAWALGLVESPSYDQPIADDVVFPAVGFFTPAGAEVLAQATLRSAEELDAKSAELLALHWRLRDFQLSRRVVDFRDFAENCWFGPISLDWARLEEGDLAFDGMPIARVPDDQRSFYTSIAVERHRAINWLHGRAELFSEVDTST